MKPADYAVIGGKGVNILVTQDEGDPAYYEAKLMFCAPKDFLPLNWPRHCYRK